MVPPDPNGDVGSGFYVQMVNVVMAVYDAGSGTYIRTLIDANLKTGDGKPVKPRGGVA